MYHDDFNLNAAAEWMPLGGAWQLADGSVLNHSDENGAKLVTGSERWKDYELDADLQLIGHGGDIGLMARSSDEERGVDAYRGYYIGLRSQDSALIIGRADHGWAESRPVPVTGGVRTGVWYHLQVVLVDCNVGAVATNLTTGQESYAAIHEADCVLQGRIGLRSLKTGGAWRHVQVHPANAQQYEALRGHVAAVSGPVYPGREDSYYRMREEYFQSNAVFGQDLLQSAPKDERTPLAPLIPIASARASSAQDSVHVRGAVTLTNPLCIQDDSAGITVQYSGAPALNLGDEIDVAGSIGQRDGTPELRAGAITLRGGRTLVLPLSVTSTQAAEGAVDARLVELRGSLTRKKIVGNQVTLELTDADQTFVAVGFGYLSLEPFAQLALGSEVRVSGICNSALGDADIGRGAFCIRLRSLDDVAVLAGPPWWSAHILPRYVLVLLRFMVTAIYAYLYMERRRVQAIVAERERLAYTMHDTLAQTFAGVGYHLQGVRNGLRSGLLQHTQVLAKLDVACVLVTRTHRLASEEIAALHPDQSNREELLSLLERTLHEILDEPAPTLRLVREGTPRELSLAARFALAIRSSASCPEATVPTTSRSGSLSSMVFSPMRTTW